MTEKVVKEGFALAEKEMRGKQVEEVKRIVLKTLEKIKEFEKIRDEAINKIKILKMDIDDLKDGKIDRIVERQEKDEKAKQISVVTIIKEVHHHYSNPWYVPYRIIWNQPLVPYSVEPVIYCNTTEGWATNTFTINNSVAADATSGCYTLTSGDIVNLR